MKVNWDDFLSVLNSKVGDGKIGSRDYDIINSIVLNLQGQGDDFFEMGKKLIAELNKSDVDKLILRDLAFLYFKCCNKQKNML